VKTFETIVPCHLLAALSAALLLFLSLSSEFYEGCNAIQTNLLIELIKEQLSCAPLKHNLYLLVTLALTTATIGCYIYGITSSIVESCKNKYNKRLWRQL